MKKFNFLLLPDMEFLELWSTHSEISWREEKPLSFFYLNEWYMNQCFLKRGIRHIMYVKILKKLYLLQKSQKMISTPKISNRSFSSPNLLGGGGLRTKIFFACLSSGGLIFVVEALKTVTNRKKPLKLLKPIKTVKFSEFF